MKFYYYPCPSTKIDNRKAQLKKKRFKLDNELADHLKSGLLCVLYVILLAMICSHNVTTDACRQNNAMSLSINDSFLVCIPDFFNIIFFLFRRTEKNLMWPYVIKLNSSVFFMDHFLHINGFFFIDVIVSWCRLKSGKKDLMKHNET